MSNNYEEKWPRPKHSKDFKALIVKLIGVFLSFIAMFVSLLPFVNIKSITPLNAVIAAIVFFSLLLLYAYLVYYEIKTLEGKRIFEQSDSVSIKNYMLYWIAYGGRVAIWTRDMSWADDEASKGLLIKKAEKGELIICLPAHTPFSEELEKKGGEIYAYGMDLLSDPSARFTIACYGRDGSKVAIGRAKADKHIIEEFDSGSHPAFNLANELVQIAKNVSSKKNGKLT